MYVILANIVNILVVLVLITIKWEKKRKVPHCRTNSKIHDQNLRKR